MSGIRQQRGMRSMIPWCLLPAIKQKITECRQPARPISAGWKPCDAKDALQQRADFPEEQGLAERRGQCVILASGRYAILDDGMGFSLVPSRPVIEKRLVQQVAATVRGDWASWEIKRQRGPSIG
ncbi:hypothetical protein DBB29_05770 [Pandoraea cepalis]|uniref:Uncharacterized protein n=1 Tax=Pandoraea cepalis TaxID=2508294 RepID=A0AAW7MKM0_9BURK|nr:hypothetical protein [Pandoraea cepalis]MDN4577623.1 hypothetical protein [Pandoraea cepalis]